MSLTSYRAAPPRGNHGRDRRRPRQRGLANKSAAFHTEPPRAVERGCKEASGFVLGRSGNDLLSRVLRHSTIGAEAFNGRVRDGIGFLCASLKSPDRPRTKRHPLVRGDGQAICFGLSPSMITNTDHKSNQANRAISTSKLNTLPRLHTWPINVVVFHGSQGRTRFEVGFPLRCLQRLSRPYIATLHCGWRHNSSTRGTSIPVLSY